MLLRLEKGEGVNAAIKLFCIKMAITNASLLALGSVENPVLAHYRVDSKKYSEKKFTGIYELVSLTGTVGLFDDTPLVHTHVSLSDEKMRSFGGHLVESQVSATVELVLERYDTRYTKSYSQEIGLKLFDLPERCIASNLADSI